MTTNETSESVSLRTLLQLLGEGGEGPHLDFKATCDLSSKRDQVELAKDIGAFSALGGHIIFGINDDGTPSSIFTKEQAASLDEAQVRAIATRYLPESVAVRVAEHHHQGHQFVLMHVAACPEFVAVFRADGAYGQKHRGSPPAEKKVFRAGDVFIRDGTSSRRWTQHHVAKFINRVVSVKKDEWLRQHRDDLLKLIRDAEGASLLDGPATSLSWRLDSQIFTSAATEAIRRSDDVALKLFLEGLVPAATELTPGALDKVGASDFKTAIDRLSTLIAIAIRLDREALGISAIKTMTSMYAAVVEHSAKTQSNSRQHATIWLLILTRVVLLGALSVRTRSWWSCKGLATQRVPDVRYDEVDWPLLHHASAMAHRNDLLASQESGVTATRLAHEDSSQLPSTTADLPVDSARLGTSILQFDLLSSIAIAATDKKCVPLTRSATPSDVEPALVTLIDDANAREHLFPPDDNLLTTIVREYEKRMKEAWYSPWTGWRSQTVRDLLIAHPEQPPAHS